MLTIPILAMCSIKSFYKVVYFIAIDIVEYQLLYIIVVSVS